ncbi:DUF4189 domain-containing protein [Ancylobacter rudongensis]|uniref:DUF4189 domain-containing protein n=1 Tax=Ancylobacter rudongensis TaxID=177413 RepID=A0A1G4PVP8_9HYPH|nr:DUF4189 domain-containing protein [Ancylobacter rudongensis]SCW36241.1 protein of unknown function [Ancylobacter rudongensis]
MRPVCAAVLIGSMLACGGPALVGPVLVNPAFGAEATYVAAAYSRSTGTVGFAEGGSDAEVRAKALSECQTGGATDCEVAFSGADMCISLARATSRNRLGLASGASRAQSQDGAMKECAATGAEGCNIHDTYCAPPSIL